MSNDKSSILSLIVPVYNVAPYLRKCVDSLLAQDYDDYEIILVDDGSTDGSGAICDVYASKSQMTNDKCQMSNDKSPIIKVLHQENRGLSAARNTGIAAAKGKYLCFVDSDDFWQPNVLASLMAQVEREQLDVLHFDYQNVRVVDAKHIDAARLESKTLDAAHLEYKVFEPNKAPRYIDRCSEVVDGTTYLNSRMGYACYAVMFIIRRAILMSNDKNKVNRALVAEKSQITNHKCEKDIILFTEGLHFEDVEWLPRMMLNAKRVNSTTTIVYNYLVREGSITKTQGNIDKVRKNLEDRMFIIRQFQSFRERHPQCHWLHRMQSSMAVGGLTTVAQCFYPQRAEYIARLKDCHAFPLAIANQGRTFTRRAYIINLLGAYIYCAIMHAYHNF